MGGGGANVAYSPPSNYEKQNSDFYNAPQNYVSKTRTVGIER